MIDLKDYYKELRQLGFKRKYKHKSWDTTCVTYNKDNIDVQLWSDGEHRACVEFGNVLPTGFTKLKDMKPAIDNQILKATRKE